MHCMLGGGGGGHCTPQGGRGLGAACGGGTPPASILTRPYSGHQAPLARGGWGVVVAPLDQRSLVGHRGIQKYPAS